MLAEISAASPSFACFAYEREGHDVVAHLAGWHLWGGYHCATQATLTMATAHKLLSHRQSQGIPVAELVRRELAPYATSNNTEIAGPGIILGAEAGQTMAMVFHELVTNAAKYGALSAQYGRVSVRGTAERTGKHAIG